MTAWLVIPHNTKSLSFSRIHCPPAAIYSNRGPFKHSVPGGAYGYNRGPPVTSRSYEFDVSHRRSQSADQTLDGKI